MSQRVLCLAGWAGSGKTTLGENLIVRLTARGRKVSTLKHAHHAFDIDQPGKDSYRQRRAGAGQVLVTSSNRWALMTELRDDPELTLEAALAKLDPCDLVLVEGFKQEAFPKMEVHRPCLGKPLLCGTVPAVQAVASDEELSLPEGVRFLDLNELDAIEAWVLEFIAWSS